MMPSPRPSRSAAPVVQQPVGGHGEEQHGGREAERDVAADVACREGQGADQGADADDDEDVEQVRAHHVADGHVALPAGGREQRDHQFGRRGADGHDREADDELRDAETLCHGRSAVREKMGAAEDHREAEEEEEQIHFVVSFFFVRCAGRGVVRWSAGMRVPLVVSVKPAG